MPYKNKEDQRKACKKHYEKNKQYYIDKANKNDKCKRIRLRAFTDRYKMYVGCVDCGYKVNPRALHFDHIKGDKLGDISTMIGKGPSYKKIKDEIRKCEVRCANCHAIVTFERLEKKCESSQT